MELKFKEWIKDDIKLRDKSKPEKEKPKGPLGFLKPEVPNLKSKLGLKIDVDFGKTNERK